MHQSVFRLYNKNATQGIYKTEREGSLTDGSEGSSLDGAALQFQAFGESRASHKKHMPERASNLWSGITETEKLESHS